MAAARIEPATRLNDARVILFLKAPRPGFVKPRIAAALDDAAAVAIYRVLVERTLATLAPFRNVELRHTPDAADPEIRPWLKPDWTVRGQGEGGLGDRLTRAFEEAQAEGCRRVIMIGADCPEMTEADVRGALDALVDLDVVVGPAVDGGYWLLGARRPVPGLFQGVAGGGDAVLAQVQARAREAGLSVGLLRSLADVDSLEDWRRFLRESPV